MVPMDNRKQLKVCLIANFITLVVVLVTVVVFADGSQYWNMGPNDGLFVISVKINTWKKYILLMVYITGINATKILSEEIGMPILSFNVYNPDKTHIDEFGKIELQVYANSMFSISSLRDVLMLMVSISQMDIAIFTVIVREITSAVAIRYLLNKKTFGSKNNEEMDSLV